MSGSVWNMGCGFIGMAHMSPMLTLGLECLASERSPAVYE